MGRPVKFDKDQAVETVMNEIWHHGFDRSSVKALSEKLNITRSSFYNAFGSRDELFQRAIERYFAQAPDRPLHRATPQTPIRPLITNVFREICRSRAKDPDGRGCLVVNGVAELCPIEDQIGALLANALMGSIQCITQLLEWARAQGEISDDVDVPSLALAVQNLMVGLSVVSKVIREEDALWAATALTLKGLDLYSEETDA